jgi:methyl-accepting chemotaxis protein
LLAGGRASNAGGNGLVSPDQVGLVQESWRKVLPISDTTAELFYSRLFTLDPALKPLFKGDMRMQRRKLIAMLDTVVHGLSSPDRLAPAVTQLGQRHKGYGAKADHYHTVAEALLWTLKQGLGDSFSEETELAWMAAYGELARLMQGTRKAVA